VQVFGDMAIAFGADMLVLSKGIPIEVTTAGIDKWRFRHGEWLAVESHAIEVDALSVKLDDWSVGATANLRRWLRG
jgi:hypothetical protein